MITLPALFLAGVEPVSAIATNKFQAASATVSATVAFARKGLIEWREARHMILASMVGGVTGALFVSAISKNLLEAAVPILLIVVACYFALAPKIASHGGKQRLSIFVFSALVAPLLGFYDGVFGPGVGSFFMVAFILLLGFGVMRAMSFTKVANAACNLGSLSVFLLKGAIIWPMAVAMAIGSFLGAQLGARCAVSIGPRLIRPMLIVMCLVMAAKLLSQPDNPLYMMAVELVGRE